MLTPANPKLGQRPPSAGHCRLKGPSAGNELDQHGVEVRADLHADVDGPAVEADACSAGRPVGGDRAGVGPEAVRRILGRDPALQRCAVDPITSWERPRSPRLSPAAMRI